MAGAPTSPPFRLAQLHSLWWPSFPPSSTPSLIVQPPLPFFVFGTSSIYSNTLQRPACCTSTTPAFTQHFQLILHGPLASSPTLPSFSKRLSGCDIKPARLFQQMSRNPTSTRIGNFRRTISSRCNLILSSRTRRTRASRSSPSSAGSLWSLQPSSTPRTRSRPVSQLTLTGWASRPATRLCPCSSLRSFSASRHWHVQ